MSYPLRNGKTHNILQRKKT